MSEQSPRMEWAYPSREDDPWFDTFKDFVVTVDGSGFAHREDRSIIWSGGGTVSWDLATETFAWTDLIKVYSPMSAKLMTVAAGSIIDWAEGEVVYLNLTRLALINVSKIFQKATALPSNDDAMAFGVRIGDTIFLRTGMSLGDGDTAAGVAPAPAASFALEIEDEGVSVDPAVNNIDFVGGGVAATQTAPGHIEVNIAAAVSVFESDVPNNEIQPSTPNIGRSFIVGSQDMDDSGLAQDSRMFFDKTTGAFRAGTVTGAEWDAASRGANSSAFGDRTTASGAASHAEGKDTLASGDYSHVEGQDTSASDTCDHAEGRSSAASGGYSHAEGYSTQATGAYSHAEGHTNVAAAKASHIEGYYNNIASDAIYSHAEGYYNNIGGYGWAAHVEGYDGLAVDVCDHVEGAFCEANCGNGGYDWYYGGGAHAEGTSTTAQGYGAHSEGYNTFADGEGAHAEGRYTEAFDRGAHTEGYSTLADGDYSHAEGDGATASGVGSHAEGEDTLAEEDYSHAEGIDSRSHVIGSHAASGGVVSAALDAQYLRANLTRVVEVAPTWVPLTIGGGVPDIGTDGDTNLLLMPTNHSWAADIVVTARDAAIADGGGSTGDTATFFFKLAAKNTPAEGAVATNTLSLGSNPNHNEYIQIRNKGFYVPGLDAFTYRWYSTMLYPTAGRVLIGSSIAESLVNLLAATTNGPGAGLVGVGGFTLAGSTITLVASEGTFTPAMNGKTITIYSAVSLGNNGTFVLTYVDPTTVTYTNASGVTESGDFNTSWSVLYGALTRAWDTSTLFSVAAGVGNTLDFTAIPPGTEGNLIYASEGMVAALNKWLNTSKYFEGGGNIGLVGGSSPWPWAQSFKDPGASAWDCRVVIGSSHGNALDIECLGDNSNLTVWEAVVHLNEVATVAWIPIVD
jgi:hypothetical protein